MRVFQISCNLRHLKLIAVELSHFLFKMCIYFIVIILFWQCCKDLHVDFDPIDKCRNGKIGNELEHKVNESNDIIFCVSTSSVCSNLTF